MKDCEVPDYTSEEDKAKLGSENVLDMPMKLAVCLALNYGGVLPFTPNRITPLQQRLRHRSRPGAGRPTGGWYNGPFTPLASYSAGNRNSFNAIRPTPRILILCHQNLSDPS